MRQTIVQELINEVTQLSRCYAIWWQLANKANRTRYGKVITEDYWDFFSTIAEAQEEVFHVLIYQLFETKNLSIRTLIKELSKSNPTASRKLAASLDDNKLLLEKVFTIRCNVHAHRSIKEAPEAVYARVKLKPNEIKKLVVLAGDLVSSIAEAKGFGDKEDVQNEITRREQLARQSTEKLLETLIV